MVTATVGRHEGCCGTDGLLEGKVEWKQLGWMEEGFRVIEVVGVNVVRVQVGWKVLRFVTVSNVGESDGLFEGVDLTVKGGVAVGRLVGNKLDNSFTMEGEMEVGKIGL